MRTHKIKILKDFADAVLSGDKTFEIRENDRGYQKGDHIRFKVLDDGRFKNDGHEINSLEYEITYVLSGWGLKNGYVALGIRRVQDGLE